METSWLNRFWILDFATPDEKFESQKSKLKLYRRETADQHLLSLTNEKKIQEDLCIKRPEKLKLYSNYNMGIVEKSGPSENHFLA